MEYKFLSNDDNILVLMEEEEWDMEMYTCWQNFVPNAEVNRYLMKVNWKNAEKEEENTRS